jgi:MoxR-like ATPase
MNDELKALQKKIEKESAFIDDVFSEIGKKIVGQVYMINRLLIGLFTGGHILVEGVPGLAKTLAVKTLSDVLNVKFQRIQFTPDLLPADIIGTLVYNPKTVDFDVKKGPIFANLVLADEINRAPAKVQSALLEAMQEKQVTIGEETFKLDKPFLVMATQNPIEQEGTYPLPEAQLDRFMMKLKIGYPAMEEERKIVDLVGQDFDLIKVKQVIGPDEIEKAKGLIEEVYVDEQIKDYVVRLVFASRDPEKYKLPIKNLIEYGASPRASIYLLRCAKAFAFLEHRAYVTPQDIKTIGYDVLRHRIIATYEAQAQEKMPDDLIKTIFDQIEVP